MYTATMEYNFKLENLKKAIEIWERDVFILAQRQPGFEGMQFLVRDNGQALAIGTWRSKDNAEAFMRTGVFKTLLEKLDGMMTGDPVPMVWKLVCSA